LAYRKDIWLIISRGSLLELMEEDSRLTQVHLEKISMEWK